jgi:hypothetical protein
MRSKKSASGLGRHPMRLFSKRVNDFGGAGGGGSRLALERNPQKFHRTPQIPGPEQRRPVSKKSA